MERNALSRGEFPVPRDTQGKGLRTTDQGCYREDKHQKGQGEQPEGPFEALRYSRRERNGFLNHPDMDGLAKSPYLSEPQFPHEYKGGNNKVIAL